MFAAIILYGKRQLKLLNNVIKLQFYLLHE